MQDPEIHSLSAFLKNTRDAFTARAQGGKIKTSDIVDAFREQGCSLLLFLFALPAALPLPAFGINFIIAIPLLLLTVQQSIGREHIWLPRKVKEREISLDTFLDFIEKSIPYVKKIEVLSKPRLHFMTHGIARNIIGLCGIIMAISVCVPLPLTNTVPSFGIAVMALGILMRDGLAVLAGAAIGLIWVGALCWFAIFFGLEGLDMMKEAIKSLL